jgi:hypothetical protein
MSKLRLTDIAKALRDFGEDYELDVLASDVLEIAEQAPVFTRAGDGRFTTVADGMKLRLQIYTERNVARFGRAPGPPPALAGALLGAAAGAAVGSAADSGRRTQSPEGLLFGMLLGGILGGAAASRVAGERQPRQVLTLHYVPQSGEWKVYRGPYQRWAKEAVRAE